jgi:hypothetical protein
MRWKNLFSFFFFHSIKKLFLIVWFLSQELMGLLEERDSEILDLKAYLDSLLSEVIANCPNILQTPVLTSQRK